MSLQDTKMSLQDTKMSIQDAKRNFLRKFCRFDELRHKKMQIHISLIKIFNFETTPKCQP
jgi:hypothetical protein